MKNTLSAQFYAHGLTKCNQHKSSLKITQKNYITFLIDTLTKKILSWLVHTKLLKVILNYVYAFLEFYKCMCKYIYNETYRNRQRSHLSL